MAIRYDDRERTLALSVRDLVEEGAPHGHLSLAVVQTSAARMALGREVHLARQGAQAEVDAAYRAEVRLQRTIGVGAWTATLHGRVDGLTEEDGRAVVEEIKSTTLDAGRLYATGLADWPAYVSQLECYLWMLADRSHDVDGSGESFTRPVGRLVLVSLADGSHHVLGVPLERDRIRAWVQERLEELVEARERRIAWMAERRGATVPVPHEAWRPGQQEIAEATEWGLDAGHQVLVEAPTGLGKTAAALTGVLRYALAHDKVVFWATSRTTQQPNLARTLELLAGRGLPLRGVLLNARDKVCLNDIVACRPDACRYAHGYYDKLRDTGLVHTLARGRSGPAELRDAGARHVVCPFELALDVSEHVDVVVGDYNYAFDPSVYLRRHFGDATAGDVIVVCDEVHQLVDRARGYGSPRISLEQAEAAVAQLDAAGDAYGPFADIARAVADRIETLVAGATGPFRDGEAVTELPVDAFADLAQRIDAVGLEYALLALQRPPVDPGEDDAWLDLARRVLRLHAARGTAGDETVAVADTRRPSIGLLCLDPSRWLGPWLGRLGGFVGLSATLSPPDFYRDLLGLRPETLDIVRVPSPFPPENRQVIVAPRVSTAWRDRAAQAEPTARLVQQCVEAVDGNVAVYFPSFDMLRDIAGRWTLGREVVVQEPGADDARRAEQLARLSADGPPVVLAAVLGGVFAEGVDLPPGALSAVLVVGPALPPVGLERDLLKGYYDDRYGEGFRYASLVPGLTRVVQAAGRLIRRPEDRGVIVLVGRRFRWRDVRELLPDDWDPAVPDDPAAEVRAFFAVEGAAEEADDA